VKLITRLVIKPSIWVLARTMVVLADVLLLLRQIEVR